MVLKDPGSHLFGLEHLSSPQQHSLADVMYEVPQLAATISPDGWAALLACSRQWRQLVHDHTSIIVLTEAAHVTTVAEGVWPCLALIVLCSQKSTARLPWDNACSSLQLLAQLNLSAGQLNCAALVVSCKAAHLQPDAAGLVFQHCPAHHQLASAFGYFSSPAWQSLSRCTVPHLHSCARHNVLAHLASVSWPALTQLDLSNIKLAQSTVFTLTRASWPALRHLDLQGCGIGTGGTEQLASGAWPQLGTLRLSKNQLTDMAAFYLAYGASWPCLEALWIDYNDFTTDGVHLLMRCNKIKELRMDMKMLDVQMIHLLMLHRAHAEGDVMKFSRYSRPATRWPEMREVHVVLCWNDVCSFAKRAGRTSSEAKHAVLQIFPVGLVAEYMYVRSWVDVVRLIA